MTKTTTWQIEPHTAAKHQLLRIYLNAWFAIMGRQSKRVIVLDGFAGPGVYSGGEPGSPKIALESVLNHTNLDQSCEYVFILNEKDEDRFGLLKTTVGLVLENAPENVKIYPFNESFGALVDRIAVGLGGAQMAPIFAFVDPFGYSDVRMDQLKRLLQFKGAELFVYFDYNSAQRFAGKGVVDPRFLELFGTDEFTNAPADGDQRGTFLRDLYGEQLKSELNFRYVQWFEMVAGRGKTNNVLFFCTRSIQGLRKMKEAMWKVAPTGDYRFIDAYAGMDLLIGPEEEVATDLRRRILVKWRGQDVAIQTLLDWVVTGTPYIDANLKTRVLRPMQAAGELTVTTPQLRRGTFPEGTVLRF